MEIVLIAAVGLNNEIGLAGKLPWSNRTELEHFKKYTMGKYVVCGRKTYDTLPVLRGRTVNFISRREGHPLRVQDVVEATKAAHLQGHEQVVVIGGGEIYKAFLPIATKLIISKMDYSGPADAYFPDLEPDIWAVESQHRVVPDHPGDAPFTIVSSVRLDAEA